MDFDYAAARSAGYSDDDILKGLERAGQINFNLRAARDAGYSSTDILQGMYGGQQRAPEPAPEPSSLLRRAGDVGLSLVRGAIAVPEAIVGLGDIVSGGAAGRGAEALGFDFKAAKEAFGAMYSPEQKAANQKLAEAQGFLPSIQAMIQNPSTIVQTAAESAPSMVAGGGIGRGALALAPRLSPIAAGAVGEGVIGAGSAAEQIRQASGGDLSIGQSGAALGSGLGTSIFSLVGGRLANKMGIGDIDTALVNAGSSAGSSKGVIRRMVEGGISEGVFEELPQSVQEQIWQNVAMDRPVMEGVGQSAAQGLIAGGLFGGVAGGALSGKPTAPVEPEAIPGETPLLPYKPDPFLYFPDGSVGRQSDADAFLASLPEDQRMAARARLYGMEPQPINTEDILQAASVQDAIDLANRAIDEGTPEFRQQRNDEIDAAWNQYLGQQAGVRMAEFESAFTQRRAAEETAMQAQLQDQAVEQANAITDAQGFDQPEPTAMQLAMAAAQERIAPQEIADANNAVAAAPLPDGPVAGLAVPAGVQLDTAAGRAPDAKLFEDLRTDGALPAATGGLPVGAAIPDGAETRSAALRRLTRVTGRQIDDEWTEFAPEAKSINIPRAEMPQIKAEHRGAMTQFLGARGIPHETLEVPADQLKPTQQEFSQAKVQAARDFTDGDRSILVSSDNRILDGHHQWLAKLESGEPVKVIRLGAPIKQLLKEVRQFPSAQVSEGAEPQTAPQNIPETIPAADPEDDAADIPVAFLKRVKVPHEVYVQDEGQYETVDMPADKALASVREDIADLRALLKCMRG